MNIKNWRVGLPLVGLVCLITLNLWLLSKEDLGVIARNPFVSLGQIAGLWGITFLAMQFVLATRLKFLETIFGGLDKVYVAHRIFGIAGMLLILYHPFLLAINAMSLGSPIQRYFWVSDSPAYSLGVVALYLFVILVLATIFPKWPYHIWKRTHIWMGLPLVISTAHIYLISSDTSRFWPLRLWILFLCFSAILAYIYKRFLYSKWEQHFSFTIQDVAIKGSITELTLAPVSGFPEFVPGQFVFLSFIDGGVNNQEKHPFTISSAPHEKNLRFSIKNLGDYTSQIKNAKVGDLVTLFGPYGLFGEESINFLSRDQVWVAGGVGITPFLSLLRYYGEQKDCPNIDLFYVVKTKEEAVYVDELMSLMKSHSSRIRIFVHVSSVDGAINSSVVCAKRDGWRGARLLMCGPKSMTLALEEQFAKMGVNKKDIVYEDFSFIS